MYLLTAVIGCLGDATDARCTIMSVERIQSYFRYRIIVMFNFSSMLGRIPVPVILKRGPQRN